MKQAIYEQRGTQVPLLCSLRSHDAESNEQRGTQVPLRNLPLLRRSCDRLSSPAFVKSWLLRVADDCWREKPRDFGAAGARHVALTVFRKQQPLRDQALNGFFVTLHVIAMAAVALFERQPRISARFAFGARASERRIGPVAI